ncbi:MAG: pyridoxine 5'-phosphate synthase [Nitrospinota bacterium]|nr:pyridoxine 5'-phosphate synthase [Nitrospinota bacterium]
MIRLFVNVDHVATIREARKGLEPDPLRAALIAEQSGADGITVHLREDRRHIQDKDVYVIHKNINTKLNLEMAATEEMISLALELKPYQISLVPEKRQEITTEGGLDVLSQVENFKRLREVIKEKDILYSLFIDPDPEQIEASIQAEADSIEINTGRYSELKDPDEIKGELKRIQEAAKYSSDMGLRVFAGHGLNYNNVQAIAAIHEIEELNIGHFLVAQSVYTGLENAVKTMIQVIKNGQSLGAKNETNITY